MRISDWSADVCSSDLDGPSGAAPRRRPSRKPGPTPGSTPGRRCGNGGSCETRPCLSLTAAGCCCPRELPGGIAGGIAGEELSGKLRRPEAARKGARSEEHTSELQSLMSNSYAVFCLKKKK